MAEQVLQPTRSRIAAPRAPLAAGNPPENYAVAVVVVTFVVTAVMALNANCRHWFVLPCAACAVLTLPDAVAWVRRQVDVFDPKPLASLILLHTTFVAPLIHMGLGFHRPMFATPERGWAFWYGVTASLWAGCLILYKAVQRHFFARSQPTQTFWALDSARFSSGLMWGVAVSAIAAAVIQLYFGGVHKESEFSAMGGSAHTSWVLMLGDPLPLLLVMALTHALTDQRRKRSMIFIVTLLAVFLVVQFALIGLRGSRSATIYAVFLVAALAHQRLRRIHPGWVLVGLAAFGVAGYFYLFFKRLGSQGWRAMEGAAERRSLEERVKISIPGVLCGDVARADIQTYLVYRIVEHRDRYNLRWGQTYLMSTLMLVPRGIWPTKPAGKVAAGTDLLYGQGRWEGRGRWRGSTAVFGLFGEAILNFGLAGTPCAFLAFGAFMGWFRRKLLTLSPADARVLVAPLYTLWLFCVPFADSDNNTFSLLRTGVLPTLIVLYAATRMRLTTPGRSP